MTAAHLLGQVEFYFSDSNLPRDVFLCEKVDEDPQARGTACFELPGSLEAPCQCPEHPSISGQQVVLLIELPVPLEAFCCVTTRVRSAGLCRPCARLLLHPHGAGSYWQQGVLCKARGGREGAALPHASTPHT